ncbi:MAG: hypothetical protein ABIM20_00800 [candidate division WOR-3 bacterium]
MFILLIYWLTGYSWNSVSFLPEEFAGFNLFWASSAESGSYINTSMVLLPAGLKSYNVESKVKEVNVSLSYLDLGTIRVTDPYGEILGEERPGVVRTSLGIHLNFNNKWRGFFSSTVLKVFQKDLNVSEFWADWVVLSPSIKGNYLVGTVRMGTFLELGFGAKGGHYSFYLSDKGSGYYTISASFNYSYRFFKGVGGFYFEEYSRKKAFKPFLILSFLPSKRLQIDYFYRYESLLPDIIGFGLRLM